MVGQTFSHYRVVSKLGEGGMGVAYSAEDLTLGRMVALKFLRLDAAGNPEARARFLREAQAGASLSHPNIGVVHEINEADGQPFIAMELVEGRSLAQKLAGGPPPLSEALEIVRQVADGLEAAHARGIVHRDIKTENIMVTGQGLVKILDFGLARLRERSRLTRSGATIGTLAYMAPEQALGEPADERADLWSLGVVLYELACGTLPFRESVEAALLYAIVHEPYVPVSRLIPNAPAELEQLIDKALRKDPAERIESAASFKAALAALKGPAKASFIAAPAVRSQKWLVPACAGLAIAAALMVWRPNLAESTRLVSASLTDQPDTATVAVPSAQDFYLQGLDYLERRDQEDQLDSAITVLERALTLDPRHAPSEAALCEALELRARQNKDPASADQAQTHCERALAMDPTLESAHVGLGLLHQAAGRSYQAVQEFDKALADSPDNAAAVEGLGRAYAALGDKAKAEDFYVRLVRLKPGDWNAHKALGVFYLGEGRYQEAAEQFRKVVELTPDNAQGYSNLGSAYYYAGNTEEARRSWEKSVSIEPRASALSNLGALLLSDNHAAEAAERFRQAIQLAPNDYGMWGNLAGAYKVAGDPLEQETYRRALELARDALAANPTEERLYSYLAKYALGAGERSEAERWIERAARTETRYHGDLIRIADTYEELGQRDKALEIVRRAYQAGADRKTLEKSRPLKDLLRDPAYQRLLEELGRAVPNPAGG